MVGAEKNGSREDASVVEVERVEGCNNFLVALIAFVHARFSSMMVLPTHLELHFWLYVILRLRRRWIK